MPSEQASTRISTMRIILPLLICSALAVDSDDEHNTTICFIWFGRTHCRDGDPDKCWKYGRYCNEYGVCQGFDSFSELKASCIKNSIGENFPILTTVTLYPARPLVLDRSLNLLDVYEKIFYDNQIPNHYPFSEWISFYHIKGFDKNLASLTSNFSGNLLENIVDNFFYKPVLSFYDNGELITECQSGIWQVNNSNVFNFLKSVYLVSSIYQSPLCPYMLENLNLDTLGVYAVNFLDFELTESSHHLNITLNTLAFNGVKKLDLSERVFTLKISRVNTLYVYQSSISRIGSKEMFASLKLSKIQIQLVNTRGFFHSCGTEWTLGLNLDKNQTDIDRILFSLNNNYSSFSLQWDVLFNTFDISVDIGYQNNKQYLENMDVFPYLSYTFPNEDFCLFANWPHEKLVIMFIVGDIDGNCSNMCTLLWLNKYIVPLMHKLSQITPDLPDWVFHNPVFQDLIFNSCLRKWIGPESGNFDNAFEACDFDQKIALCNITPVAVYHDSYFDLYDFKSFFDQIKSVSLTYFLPSVSLFGIITNFLIVFVIMRNKPIVKALKKQNQTKQIILIKEPLYQYMVINACFNLALCLVRLVNNLIPCIPDIVLVVRSSVIHDYQFLTLSDKCHIKDEALEVIASYLKLMSNFFYIQMCISRMLLVGKDHGNIYTIVSSIKKKTYFAITSLISLLLVVVVYYQQSTIDWRKGQKHVYLTDYYYNDNYRWSVYDHSKNQTIDLGDAQESLSRIPWLLAFTIIYDVFSYLLFVVAGILIDLSTLIKLKESLLKKESVKNTKSTVEATTTDLAKTPTLSGENREAEKKMVVMIILNSSCNILLRLPDLFAFILFSFSASSPYVYRMLCVSFRECLAMSQLVDCGYLLSIGLNFFFFYFFNKNFHEATHLSLQRHTQPSQVP